MKNTLNDGYIEKQHGVFFLLPLKVSRGEHLKPFYKKKKLKLTVEC